MVSSKVWFPGDFVTVDALAELMPGIRRSVNKIIKCNFFVDLEF